MRRWKCYTYSSLIRYFGRFSNNRWASKSCSRSWPLYFLYLNILWIPLRITIRMHGFRNWQGSRWTLQATLMDCKVKDINWEIKPDQMQTIHPVLAFFLTLSFDRILFPFLAMFGIRRPLQKLIFSNFMAVIAFLMAAVLQYKIFVSISIIGLQS